MISKSVVVFWSVACLTIFVHLVGKDGGATAFYILAMGLMWAIVVVPTALVGKLFKSRKVYSTKMRVLRGSALTAIGLITFVVVHASQQSTPMRASEKVTIDQSKQRGFQPWPQR
jgi:hypothetical protein